MRALRRHRGWLSGWLVAVLLVTQLVTAAYACPQLAPAGDSAAAMASMPDCDGSMPAAMDPDQPQLCLSHCESAAASVNSQPAPQDLAAIAATGPALLVRVDLADPARLAACRPRPVAEGPPTGSPPLYLSFLALRN